MTSPASAPAVAPPLIPMSPSPAISLSPVPVAPSKQRMRLKLPSSPDFSGERSSGQAFLNSCMLYLRLALEQFSCDKKKDFLDPCLLQGWTSCKVVREPLLPRGRHWHFSHSVLDWLWTTVPKSVLFSQRGVGCHQHLERVFILSRKSDGGWLLRQFPDPGLRRRIHRPLDPCGEVPLRPQVKHLEPNCYHALRTTRRHGSEGLVCSCPEDQPGEIGKRGFPIHALDDNLGSLTLHPTSFDPSLNVSPSLAGSTPRSTKAPL